MGIGLRSYALRFLRALRTNRNRRILPFGSRLTPIFKNTIHSNVTAERITGIIQKAQKRAASVVLHPLELPAGVHNAKNTRFFVNREIKLHARYKTIFSTMLISYERVVDPWTTTGLS